MEGFTFTYRRASQPAVRDISLSVEAGEVVLVAGPSGCGKSTLIRGINGLIPHAYNGTSDGEVRIEGRAVSELRLRDLAQVIGTVLQDPARQIVGATVEAELAFGPENLAVPRETIRDGIREVFERTSIGHLAGRETAALSGGERQLVAVGGILMMRPKLYVVDEPLANLDPATASQLLAILRRMADEGSAVVIVEHRVEEALELRPDRVLYMEAGATAYLGPVDGFLEIADPALVKLPFAAIVEQVRRRTSAAASTRGSEPSRIADPPWAPLPAIGPAWTADAEASSIEDRGPVASAPRPPRLAYTDVRAGYGDREILHGVSARLGATETVALLGPNGSGKTTLFKAAMKLLPLMGGSIACDGEDTAQRRVAEMARTFGYVFQSPSQMFFARTVQEELLFGPRNLGADASTFDELTRDALARVGLDAEEAILERPPMTLSFGQQKRLSIAIALCMRPRTLILDEPSAGQDHASATRFMAQVRAIPGIESLYIVTHDVDLALTHADRILLFREGRVVADGPPAEVVADLDRWRACNLRETTLMQANARWAPADGGFVDAERLAVVAAGQS
ncbi:MAG TPA: ABC transporter ATP-binding protein [Candidatus Saccharimonadia bacterium]|nr:ABC transporter ATP-binding protein [Candidatus Saccharimonadia bacterium]